MNGRQETGNQPDPDVVAKAVAEDQLQLTREEWILTRPWRHGKHCDTIICDPPPSQPGPSGEVYFYGGTAVLMACPLPIRQHVLDLHNQFIGFDKATETA